jgi:hypothetical protein
LAASGDVNIQKPLPPVVAAQAGKMQPNVPKEIPLSQAPVVNPGRYYNFETREERAINRDTEVSRIIEQEVVILPDAVVSKENRNVATSGVYLNQCAVVLMRSINRGTNGITVIAHMSPWMGDAKRAPSITDELPGIENKVDQLINILREYGFTTNDIYAHVFSIGTSPTVNQISGVSRNNFGQDLGALLAKKFPHVNKKGTDFGDTSEATPILNFWLEVNTAKLKARVYVAEGEFDFGACSDKLIINPDGTLTSRDYTPWIILGASALAGLTALYGYRKGWFKDSANDSIVKPQAPIRPRTNLSPLSIPYEFTSQFISSASNLAIAAGLSAGTILLTTRYFTGNNRSSFSNIRYCSCWFSLCPR